MTKSKTQPSQKARVLYWFRTDLRVHDSPALQAALALEQEVGIEAFYPVWCFDPQYVWKHRVGVNRWNFLLDSMSDLSSALTKLNPKQKLLVLRGSPEKVLPLVFREWGITHLVFEKDTAAYARQRDELIGALVKESFPDIKIIVKHGHNLYDPEEVVKKGNAGKAITTLMSWKKAAAKVADAPARPLPTPTSLPDPGSTSIDPSHADMNSLEKIKEENPTSIRRANKPVKEEGTGDGNPMEGPFAKLDGINVNREIMDNEKFDCFDTIAGPDKDYAVPTFDSLGLEKATTHIRGGETEALRRLEAFLNDAVGVATFSKPKSSPNSLEPSTTLLSPYLKFGCMSVRKFYWDSQDVCEKYAKEHKGASMTKEPENLAGQLEFRDMYYCAEFATAKYERIQGNSLSRFIAWKLRNQYDKEGRLVEPRPRGEDVDEERFLAWKEGRTGFPWIDAIMRQLKQEGWIHHLARHSVACYLTRGQCYISWERGTEVFDEYLLDWDPASNPGNWMWLSCSAFFSQYFRVYGLESFPSKTDKKGDYVRKYCEHHYGVLEVVNPVLSHRAETAGPELAKFPDKFIYNPSSAPLSVQDKAGCIIGQDYPEPILDEQKEKARCIARLKVAFEVGLHGNSPEVMEGTAEEKLKARFREKNGRDEDEDDEAPSTPKKRKNAPVENGPMDKFLKKSKKEDA